MALPDMINSESAKLRVMSLINPYFLEQTPS